jgi:2-hydroxychromene-2-carboxylate isomerase
MGIEFFYEFASTYSYPAAMGIDAMAAERNLTVTWRPFLLGPVFAAQGMTDSPFNLFPVKGQYMWRDLARCCAELGFRFQKPSVFPRRTVLAARVALLGMAEGWGAEFSRLVYQANFADDREIDDPAVLGELLSSLGLPAEDVLSRATAEDNKLLLRTQTERAIKLGVFGAPTFVVDGEVFWGHDRMRQACDWAARNKPA